VIVTHSNQALNQLFEKIMHLDIDERHLLRLGHGEEMLETEKDFSRYGRVNYVLQQRLALLKEVNRMQQSLGVKGDVSYTCETAGHFYLYQVLSRWEKFEEDIKNFQEAVLEKKEEFSGYFLFIMFFSSFFSREDWKLIPISCVFLECSSAAIQGRRLGGRHGHREWVLVAHQKYFRAARRVPRV